MTDEEKVDEFVEKLSKCDVTFKKSVENMYATNENTVNNLKLYLKKMLKIKPKYLLVGKAPGYSGCRLTGIPFTSEEILKDNDFFGDEFECGNSSDEEKTAKFVWEYLDSKGIYPLMWNAFPFYICEDINNQEFEFGKRILKEIMDIFHIDLENVIAVGNDAEDCLKSFFIKKVRQPARCGPKAFAASLDEYLK